MKEAQAVCLGFFHVEVSQSETSSIISLFRKAKLHEGIPLGGIEPQRSCNNDKAYALTENSGTGMSLRRRIFPSIQTSYLIPRCLICPISHFYENFNLFCVYRGLAFGMVVKKQLDNFGMFQ